MTLDDYKMLLVEQEKFLDRMPFSGFPHAFPPDLRDQLVASLQAVAALKNIINRYEHPEQ